MFVVGTEFELKMTFVMRSHLNLDLDFSESGRIMSNDNSSVINPSLIVLEGTIVRISA